MRRLLLLIVTLTTVAGCAGRPEAQPAAGGSPTPSATSSSSPPAPSAPARAHPRPPRTSTDAPPLRGVDVSHHQGAIDWERVAGDDIDFAYVKATEGSTFTDPRLAENWAGAERAGLAVGAYHYFTLCSPPLPQADHFAGTLRSVGFGRRSLPPAVDLELIGNCDPPPERAAMLTSVWTFIERVEARTGRKVVVYFHPDFEATYSLVRTLDRRLWVRRVGSRPPPGDWWLWQRTDHGRVAGIGTPVDIDVRS